MSLRILGAKEYPLDPWNVLKLMPRPYDPKDLRCMMATEYVGPFDYPTSFYIKDERPRIRVRCGREVRL